MKILVRFDLVHAAQVILAALIAILVALSICALSAEAIYG